MNDYQQHLPATVTTCAVCGATITEALAADALCIACRYHNAPKAKSWDTGGPKAEAAELPRIYDERGRYVATAEPAHVPPTSDDIRRDAIGAAVVGLLRMLAGAGSALLVGQRCLILAYLSGALDGIETDAELAERLDISASRLSHVKREIPNELASLGRLKRRQAQGRAIGRRS